MYIINDKLLFFLSIAAKLENEKFAAYDF